MGVNDSLGLGVILSAKNMLSGEADKAAASLKSLQSTSKNTAKSLSESTERAGMAMKGMALGALGFTSASVAIAGITAGITAMGVEAAKSEDRLAGISTMLIGQGMSMRQARYETENFGNYLREFSRTTRVPYEEMELGSERLLQQLGFEQMKASIKPLKDLILLTGSTGTDAAETMSLVLQNYSDSWGNLMSPMEKANRVSRDIIGTMGLEKVSFEYLGQAMRYAAGEAAVMGIPLEDLSILIGSIESRVPRAGMAFMNFIKSLSKFQGMTGNRGMLGGIRMTDREGRLRPIVDILEDIEKMFGITSLSASKAQKHFDENIDPSRAFASLGIPIRYANALTDAFQDGSRILAILVGHSEELRQSINKLGEAKGIEAFIESMRQAKEETTAGSWGELKNNLKDLGDTIGKSFLPQANVTLKDLTENLRQAIALLRGGGDQLQGKIDFGLAPGPMSMVAKKSEFLFGIFGDEAREPRRYFSQQLRGAMLQNPYLFGPAMVADQIAANTNQLLINRPGAIGFGDNPSYDHSYNQTNVQIFTQPGMSPDDIAKATVKKLDEKKTRSSARGM